MPARRVRQSRHPAPSPAVPAERIDQSLLKTYLMFQNRVVQMLRFGWFSSNPDSR